VPKIKGLSPKQKTFVAEYLVDLNATEAALRAGYSKKSAASIGQENLQKPAIAEAVEKALADRVERIEITQDAVVQELACIAFGNISDVAEWEGEHVKVLSSSTRSKRVLAAVAGVSETQHGLTVRMHDKQAALLNLGKHLGMFREKVELEVRDGASVLDKLFNRLDDYATRAEGS